MNRLDLPIFELEAALVEALRVETGARAILQAPTGSGKSTQVPQILLDAGLLGERGEVVVLQPRRLATRMLAARVAKERGCRLGGEVGFQIRFDKVVSAETRIRFVTEGVLLRQMLSDERLPGVAALVFDEFHERHLHGDITLARALELQATVRPDLKVVVMSATLDTAGLEAYMSPCAVLRSEGRTFPVEIRYLLRPLKEAPVWDSAAAALEELAGATGGTEGDVLIFMPGVYEISRTIGAIRQSRVSSQFAVFPLHGELPVAEQDAAVAPGGKRKVIVSTNVAETSLTIEGVRVVIDAGLAKVARFDPYRGINTLLVEKISRASADQRAGRAGRTAPGVALRLWTEREHSERPAQEVPEVKRLDLAEVVLTLKASGVGDVAAFRWLEQPEARSLARAEALLSDLGALEGEGLSAMGRRMLAFPLHPRYARMLIAAGEYGCVREAALVAALTQGRSLLRKGGPEEARERALGEEHRSDLFLLMRAWDLAMASGGNGGNGEQARALGINGIAAREAAQLASQFLRIAKAEGLEIVDAPAPEAAVAKCILAGFPDQVAVRLDAGTLRCGLVHGRKGVLARESAVQRAPLLVVGEIREVGGKAGVQTLLTMATAIEEEWLRELFPEAFADHFEVFYDRTLRRVMGRRERRFHDLVLQRELTDKTPPGEAARLLASEVMAGNCPLEHWDHAVEQWIVRLNRLREWMPELGLPALETEDRAALVEQICYGAATYKEIKTRQVWPVVKSWLSPMQLDLLEKYAPERLEMPNGRRFKIVYDEKAAPTIAVRIQDLYGVERSLPIAAGRMPVTIQVLAPNHRPIQVTQDLATFWRESYPGIKQELQRRYPKHLWK